MDKTGCWDRHTLWVGWGGSVGLWLGQQPGSRVHLNSKYTAIT